MVQVVVHHKAPTGHSRGDQQPEKTKRSHQAWRAPEAPTGAHQPPTNRRPGVAVHSPRDTSESP
eukprot:3502026-Pyramimonas_sp.AAC.1